MNCKCCCTNTLDYCDQNVCDEIDFDILAQMPGVHKLVTEFLNTQIIMEKEFIVGESITFPLEGLNENYQYTAELYDAIGNKILIRKNNVDYDCFRFRTTIAVSTIIASS